MCSINIFNRINNLNLRADTTKLSEENIGGKKKKENIGKNLLDTDLGNDVYRCDTKKHKRQKQKSTNGTTSTKELLHSKRNNQWNKKTTYRMGKDICKSYIG